MSYLLDVSERLAGLPLLLPAAGVAVFDREGRVLLGPHRHDGSWATPGGGVEPGESPLTAARRELTEETSLIAGPCQLFGAYGGPDFVVIYHSEITVAYVVTMYGCVETSGTARADGDELESVQWFRRAETLHLALGPDMRVVVPDAFSWYDRRTPAVGS